MSLNANKLRPGIVVEYEGVLWSCMQAIHKSQGRKSGFVQAKFRNVKDGSQKEFKFHSDDTLEQVQLMERPMQFLYESDGIYTFMDQQDYNQVELSQEMMGDTVNYLLSDSVLSVTFYEGTPIGVSLPQKMEFKVIEAEPNLKSATATAAFKNAKIETGLNVKVPHFIEADTVIVVNTETGEYVERAKG